MRNKNNLRVLRALHELPVCDGLVAPRQILSVNANIVLSMIASETMTCINPQVSRYRYLSELAEILQFSVSWDKLPKGSWVEYAKTTTVCGKIDQRISAEQLANCSPVKLISQFMPTSNQDPVGVANHM